MALFLVSGPCELWAGVGPGGNLQFLGIGDDTRINMDPAFEDVYCDLAGPKKPLDVQYFIEDATITTDVRLVDPGVFAACQSRGDPFNTINDPPGTFSLGSVGGLMVQEEATYRFLIFSPYTVNKPTQAKNRHWNFRQTYLAGPDNIGPIGTRVTTLRCVFRAIPEIQSDGSFVLCDQDATGKGNLIFGGFSG